MTPAPLAAIPFESENIDAFIEDVAQTLTHQGRRVVGVTQSRSAESAECQCADMDLITITSARTFRISQPLGNGSHGCRLHPGALAECSAFLANELEQGADLLILNRFGRGESEGRGFRDLISTAVALDIPVLTAVRPPYAQAWADFSGDIACTLPMQKAAVLDWFSSLLYPDFPMLSQSAEMI